MDEIAAVPGQKDRLTVGINSHPVAIPIGMLQYFTLWRQYDIFSSDTNLRYPGSSVKIIGGNSNGSSILVKTGLVKIQNYSCTKRLSGDFTSCSCRNTWCRIKTYEHSDFSLNAIWRILINISIGYCGAPVFVVFCRSPGAAENRSVP